MYPTVPTNDATAVEVEVQSIYLDMFPKGDRLMVPQIFGWAIECFNGRYRDYQAIDALYHDFEHTLQGTLCLARLLKGRHAAGAVPVLTENMFELAMLAILFHDTGYLKKHDDKNGTGAKYTVTHVARSADFAGRLLKEKRYKQEQILAVQNMIRCTGVSVNVRELPFQNELERTLGFCLATADLVGQMAADDYVDKLPVLYCEFEEAAHFSGDTTHFIASFGSATELIQRTRSFWNDLVLPRLEKDFCGVYRFLSHPYPDGPNEYLQRIQAQVGRLKGNEPARKRVTPKT